MTGSFSGSRGDSRGPKRSGGSRFNSRGGAGAPRAVSHRPGFRAAHKSGSSSHSRTDGAPSHARAHSSHTGDRPSYGGERRSFGGSRGGFGGGAHRGGFGGGGRGQFGNRGGRGGFGGGRSNRKPDEQIDIQRFINRSVVTTEEVATVFVPEHKFSDFAISPVIKENLAKKGYELPTPIQDRAVPHIVRGEDVVGIANTGTGKTGAFLIPLIERVLQSHREKGDLRVLIMVPTRELALQIEEEFRGFAVGLRLSSVIAVGGLNINPQMRALRRPHNFVIGTPGRIKDLVERKFLELPKFSAVVLDEADRMLDMGFIKDMREIMGQLPKERHTLFFSATLSRDVEALIGDFLKDPVRISVKTRETSANIDQDIVKVPPGTDKIEFLANMLKGPEYSKVIIFGRTKHGVDKLARVLSARGLKAECIHGNKTHNNRVRALDMFKTGRAPILVATDVAARGLDIPNVTHVINYDVPATYDDYVHRIGRTGRGEKKGKALTFVN